MVIDSFSICHFLSLLGDFEFAGTFLVVCRKGKDSLLTRNYPSVVRRFGEMRLQSDSFRPKKQQKATKK